MPNDTRTDGRHQSGSGDSHGILPCPCGGAAKVQSNRMIDHVTCTVCENETAPFFDGIPDAIREWNAFCRREPWAVKTIEIHMAEKQRRSE